MSDSSFRKKNGLMIASLNIVSLRKQRHELEIIMNNHKIDILALNETRLDRKVEDREVHIPGYKIYRNDRNIDGVGVAIYAKDTLPDPKVRIKSNDLELLCLEIILQQAKNFYLLSWYRPQQQSFTTPPCSHSTKFYVI